MNKLLLALIFVLGVGGCEGADNAKPPQATCTATLTWEPPYDRVGGAPLSTAELEKYTIYISRQENTDTSFLLRIVEVSDTNLITYEVDDLPRGMKYFYMTATDMQGIESTFSNILSKIC